MKRTEADAETYWQVIARDTDIWGNALCLRCGVGKAADVHEILPRSFFGKSKEDELFAEKNRCCLCRPCHGLVHNNKGRGELLQLMREKYHYEYTGRAQCLLEDYLEEGQ